MDFQLLKTLEKATRTIGNPDSAEFWVKKYLDPLRGGGGGEVGGENSGRSRRANSAVGLGDPYFWSSMGLTPATINTCIAFRYVFQAF